MGRLAYSKFPTESTKISFVAHNNYITANPGEFCVMLYIHSQSEADQRTMSEVCMIMQTE